MGSLRIIAIKYTAAVYREAMVTEDAGVFQRAGLEAVMKPYSTS
jgi:hypothetical protein